LRAIRPTTRSRRSFSIRSPMRQRWALAPARRSASSTLVSKGSSGSTTTTGWSCYRFASIRRER